MVKSDAHMAKIKGSLVRQETEAKASEDAKKQRGLKKFGKAVQVTKGLERAKEKRDVLEKVKEMR